MGTWSTGKRPHPQLNSVPSEDLGPDPILVMADVVPSWEGHVGVGLDISSPGYIAPPPNRSRDWSHDRSHGLHNGSHDPSQSRSLGSLSSCSSGSYDHLTPPQPPQDPTHCHTHPLHFSQCHTHPSELLYSRRGKDDYELVDPPINSSDADLSSTGRSTALPPLSYTSSLSPSPEEGRGSSEEEEEEDHMRELQKAGLELARAGLELAGYEGANLLDVGEGTDKEWEQWQQINEEEQGSVTIPH